MSDYYCSQCGIIYAFGLVAILQLGNWSSAYFTVAIALHAFTSLVLRVRHSTLLCGVMISFGWLAAIAVGEVLHEGRGHASHKLLSFGSGGRKPLHVRPCRRNVQFRANPFNGKVSTSRSTGNYAQYRYFAQSDHLERFFSVQCYLPAYIR